MLIFQALINLHFSACFYFFHIISLKVIIFFIFFAFLGMCQIALHNYFSSLNLFDTSVVQFSNLSSNKLFPRLKKRKKKRDFFENNLKKSLFRKKKKLKSLASILKEWKIKLWNDFLCKEV